MNFASRERSRKSTFFLSPCTTKLNNDRLDYPSYINLESPPTASKKKFFLEVWPFPKTLKSSKYIRSLSNETYDTKYCSDFNHYIKKLMKIKQECNHEFEILLNEITRYCSREGFDVQAVVLTKKK